jgi:hypothetical protein
MKLEQLLPGKRLGTRHCRLETASGSPSWPDGGPKCEWNDRIPDAAMKADRPSVLLLEDRKTHEQEKKVGACHSIHGSWTGIQVVVARLKSGAENSTGGENSGRQAHGAEARRGNWRSKQEPREQVVIKEPGTEIIKNLDFGPQLTGRWDRSSTGWHAQQSAEKNHRRPYPT